jgi:hypothetical protein
MAQDHPGYLFKSDDPASFCFVPEECVFLGADGSVQIDEIKYFTSGWSVRNMRSGDSESGGSFLFPQADKLVRELTAPAVQKFLERISGHPA